MPPPLTTKTAGSEIALQKGGGALEVMPRNFGELEEFAIRMAKSRYVPPPLRGKPEDCLMIALQAYRWEMDPIAVAQQTYFPRDGGPPAYMAQLIAAVVHARAPLEGRLKIKWSGQWPQRTCTVTGKLRGDDDVKERTVHAVNITVRNSPLWKTDPDQQLAYYAERAWARLYVPDVLMGVHSREEPMDEEERATWATDVTPSKNESTPAPRETPASQLDGLEEIIDQQAEAVSQERIRMAHEAIKDRGEPERTEDIDANEPGVTDLSGVTDRSRPGDLSPEDEKLAEKLTSGEELPPSDDGLSDWERTLGRNWPALDASEEEWRKAVEDARTEIRKIQSVAVVETWEAANAAGLKVMEQVSRKLHSWFTGLIERHKEKLRA